MVERLVVDGKVAVLVSAGYGAGWSTWSCTTGRESMLFDPDIARALLEIDPDPCEKGYSKVLEIAGKKYPEEYLGGVDGLYVVWVDQGKRFRIDEYDGAETLAYLDEGDLYVA